jgi:hypothetical protein
MTSFIRTIPREEQDWYVKEILSRTDDFIPLKGKPLRAKPRDFMYLVCRGLILARARIDRIQSGNFIVLIGSNQHPYQAKCKVRYRGGWQRCPRQVPFKGSQGIRYVDTVGLAYLNAEEWPHG